MDLRSDYPYWLLRQGIIRSYPSLDRNITTGIVIMGGGISGALAAWYLGNAGFDTLLVDRRHIGMGSTAASTSLLQYEIDIPLYELINKIGEEKARRSYLLCREAINSVARIAEKLKIKNGFKKRPSFQFCSYAKDKKNLEKEFLLRRKAGFAISWLEGEDILRKYGFAKSAGILSEDGAEADAYQLTHALLEKSVANGLRVYDHTAIVEIRHHKRTVELLTDENKIIKARKLIIACGYESQQYIPRKVQELNSTYVIISEPNSRRKQKYPTSICVQPTITGSSSAGKMFLRPTR